MRRRVVGGFPALLFLAAPALVAACVASEGPSGGIPRSAGPGASSYFVSEAPGWTAKEAYKPRRDDPITSDTEPALDWYSEHERFPDPSRSLAVRVSGHLVAMHRLEASLAGFELRSRTVLGLRSRTGSGPGGPRVVLLPVAPDYTVMTLSYELTLDELVKWSNALKEVDEAGWIASGGVIAP